MDTVEVRHDALFTKLAHINWGRAFTFFGALGAAWFMVEKELPPSWRHWGGIILVFGSSFTAYMMRAGSTTTVPITPAVVAAACGQKPESTRNTDVARDEAAGLVKKGAQS